MHSICNFICGPKSKAFCEHWLSTLLQERVLYRLLSGWHASTSISIAKNYYAPGTQNAGTIGGLWKVLMSHTSSKYHDLFVSWPLSSLVIPKLTSWLLSNPPRNIYVGRTHNRNAYFWYTCCEWVPRKVQSRRAAGLQTWLGASRQQTCNKGINTNINNTENRKKELWRKIDWWNIWI